LDADHTIDVCGREIMAWSAVTAGVSAEMVYGPTANYDFEENSFGSFRDTS
jgi:hypothetical protein